MVSGLITGACWGGLIVWCGYSLTREALENRDRRRHIAECRARESLEMAQARAERQEWERLRSGAAFAEAMWLTLEEIHDLPEVEPRRRIA